MCWKWNDNVLCFSVKNDGLVDEYALSQTTLEQVFLQFARQQEEDDDKSEDENDSFDFWWKMHTVWYWYVDMHIIYRLPINNPAWANT